MKTTTYYRIAPSTTPGWFNIISKETGAVIANVKGYSGARAEYRRKNKAKAKARELAAGKGRAA